MHKFHKSKLLLITLVLPFMATAQSLEKPVQDKNVMEKSLDWSKAKRDNISKYWLGTSRGIDAWLSGDESVSRNKSRINIGMKQTLKKSGDHESDFYIRGKLDIPNTKRKLKLFFDSDTNDQDSLENKQLNTTDQSYSTVGIGRTNKSNKFIIDTDIGAKFRIPLDPFYRTKIKYEYDLNKDWKNGFEQKLWYYHKKGWGESSEIYFKRDLSDHYALTISTQAQYQKRYESFEFGQFFTLHQNLPGSNWNSFTFGVTGSNKPNPRVNSYFLSSSYKKFLHEDWVLLSVDPRLRFIREDSWKPNPELEFRIDVYFKE